VHANCFVSQNLAVDVELLEDIANGDVVPELVGLAHRSDLVSRLRVSGVGCRVSGVGCRLEGVGWRV
jgi:hypothetical protein